MTPQVPPSMRPTPLCARYAPLLALLRTDALSPEEAAQLHEHVSGCPWCQREAAAYDALDTAARRHFGHVATLAIRLDEIMDAESGWSGTANSTPSTPATTSTMARPRPSRRPSISALGALAAVLLLALLASVLLVGHNGFPFAKKQSATPQSHATTTFALPAGVATGDITSGPDGNIWFADAASSAIGKMTTSGVVTMYPSSPSFRASSITAGPDGNIWFTEMNFSTGENRVGRMTPDGTLTEFPVSGTGSGCVLGDIVRGAGDTLWALEGSVGVCAGVIEMKTDGSMQRYPLPDLTTRKGEPAQAAVDASGSLWFTELDSSYKASFISKMTPDGALTEYPMPNTAIEPGAITLGPDNSIWFACFVNGEIGRISSGGTLTFYTISFPPGQIVLQTSLTAGADGNLWFLDFLDGGGSGLGSVTTNGTITMYPVSLGQNYPHYARFIAGLDGNLWFTATSNEQTHGVIVRFTL